MPQVLLEEEEMPESIRKPSERNHVSLKKDPRRRTIYIPTEDTTIMTIHPGAPSRLYPKARRPPTVDMGLELLTLAEEEPPGTEDPTSRRQSKGSRKSLSVAPRRVPLGSSRRQLQAPTVFEDVEGSGGGKENLPPGQLPAKQISLEKPKVRKPLHATGANVNRKPVRASLAHPQSRMDTPAEKVFPALDSPEGDVRPRASVQSAKQISPKPVIERLLDRESRLKRQSILATSQRPNNLTVSSRFPTNHTASDRSSKGSFSLSKAGQPVLQFPVITDDLSRPELYEEHWLAQQETSLTQLLNGIFESLEPKPNPEDGNHGTLRRRLLTIYQSHDVTILHKRIKASLRYGALCVSKDTVTRQLRLRDDIGLQKKFLALWIDSYDHSWIKTALEAIVGREIPQDARLSGTSPQAWQSPERTARRQRTLLGAFVNAFLIHHEDAPKSKSSAGSIAGIALSLEKDADDADSSIGSWRRTVLRSLMLILVLDKAKAAAKAPKNLFQKTSPYKSSAELLVAFARLLLPSVGDIVKTLSHLHYALEVVQTPLQEYTYHVRNMATDLRDGVMLTRLVEALLYSPTRLELDRDRVNEPTITLNLPDGGLLTCDLDGQTGTDRPFSQHLKVPATSRVQKMYNVDVALCAAASANGTVAQMTKTVSATDIVDGHREKTLSLLWSLVSHFGQDLLVDWTEVQAEIRRAQHLIPAVDLVALNIEYEDTIDRLNPVERSRALLRTWATLICHLHGIQITNLTTSFASGHAFTAIIDEYSAFFPTTSPIVSSPSPSSSLPSKLTSLGVSRAFLHLLSPTTAPQIPSTDLTLQLLLFLSSRLLPLARRHRSATVLQRAWRTHARRAAILTHLHRRVACSALARDCALVVHAREAIVGAAVRIQRAWRACLARRIARLEGDVAAVQSLARGWMARRRAERMRRVARGRYGALVGLGVGVGVGDLWADVAEGEEGRRAGW